MMRRSVFWPAAPARRVAWARCSRSAIRSPSGSLAGVGGGTGRSLHPLGDQRLQRVHFLDRIEIEDQAVLVGGHRHEREDLGHGGLLQVDHHAHHARRMLGSPDAGDERIVGLYLGHQFAQLGAEVESFDVHRQARGIGQ